jgi:hypothetical protein
MDKHSLEIIVEICFLINELKHQFCSAHPPYLNNIFRCDEEIRSRFDALISSFDMSDFQRKYHQIRETVRLHQLINNTTEVQYEGKQKVIAILEKLQSALTVLNESLISHL